MEGTIFAAQKQALSTNAIKENIYKMWDSKKVAVVPIIVGTLGSIPVNPSTYLEKLYLANYIEH